MASEWMRRLVMASAVLVGSCGRGLAADPAELLAAFPQAQPGTLDVGVALKMRIGTVITPVRFAPKAGLSQAFNNYWCGVLLEGPAGATQAIVTVGVGESEALSCEKFIAAGVVVPRGSAAELALIYEADSPNVDNQMPVLLYRDRAGQWEIDNRRSDELSDRLATVTIPAIRKALATQVK